MRHALALRLFALLLLGPPVVASASQTEVRGPFRGRIVDRETGRPIEGAVVLAVWETRAFSPLGHGGQAFHDSREAVSGADGHFEIPQLPTPLATLDLQPPMLFFFAPGYVLAGPNLSSVPIHALADRLSGEHASYQVTPPDAQPFIGPTMVRMRPIKTKEEWCRYSFHLPPLEHSMANKMPLTLEAINRERRVRGTCA